jgi:hypothetical protein
MQAFANLIDFARFTVVTRTATAANQNEKIFNKSKTKEA